jgi:DNA-binding transcriptional LysR family regulator
VLAAPDYLARRGTPQHPDELRLHNCLIYSYANAASVWRFRGPGDEEVVVPVRGNFEVNNGLAEREAALAGLGILATPSFYVADEVRRGALVPLLTDWTLPELALYAVYPERRLLAPKVRAFIDFLGERIGDRPYWDRG